MHRSGTSLVSGILERLGVSFGDNLLPAMDGVNEKGFWEDRCLVEAHEALLDSLKRQWHDIRPLPEGWLLSAAAARFKETVKGWLQDEFGNSSLFGMKDPRICLFLPLWRQIFSELGIKAHCVVVLRNPLEIAASLMKRDNLPPIYSLVLSQYYTSSIWKNIDGFNYSTIHYSDLIEDWQAPFKLVGEESQLDFSLDAPGKDAGGILDAQLRHHSFDIKIFDLLAEMLKDSRCWPEKQIKFHDSYKGITDYLYIVQAIWEEKHSQLSELTEELKSLGEEHLHAQAIVGEREAQRSKLTGELKALGEEHLHAQEVVGERDAQLSKLTGELKALGEEHLHAQAIVAERDAQLSNLTEELKSLGEEHLHAQAIVGERDAQLSKLTGELKALGEEHLHAQEVVGARDVQLSKLTGELKALGEEHHHAQEVVSERDAQLSKLTGELKALGEEHHHAQEVVSERDAQLSKLTGELKTLGEEHRHAQEVVGERDAQLSKLTEELKALGEEHRHAQEVVSERDAQLSELTKRLKAPGK